MKIFDLVKPKRLKPGDTVGIISPGSPAWSQANIRKVSEWWESHGYKVKLSANLNKRFGYSAGSALERADDVNEMIKDDSVSAIAPLHGGCSSAQILEYIDYDAFNSNPKIFTGYSDITSMHLAFAKFTNVITFHSPGCLKLANEQVSDYTIKHFFNAITSANPLGHITLANDKKWLYTIHGGTVTAPLIGGNLSLLCSSIGTPYEFDAENCILFIEEVNEEPWVVLNCLIHLQNAKKLDGVVGVVIAEGENVAPLKFEPSFECNKSHEDILHDFFVNKKIPVLYGLPMGHTMDMAPFPMRAMATLNASAKTLEIIEGGVC